MQRTWTQNKSAGSGLLYNWTQFSMSWAPKPGLEICCVEFGMLCLTAMRNRHIVKTSLTIPEDAFFLSSMASEPHAPPHIPSCLLFPSSCCPSHADSVSHRLTRLSPPQDFVLSPLPLVWVPLSPSKRFSLGTADLSSDITSGHLLSTEAFSLLVTTLDTVSVCCWALPPEAGPYGRGAALVCSLLALGT